MTLTFNIWFLKEDHKHHHSAMILICIYIGVQFLIIGWAAMDIFEIIALAFFLLSCVSFVSGFYYVIEKKVKI